MASGADDMGDGAGSGEGRGMGAPHFGNSGQYFAWTFEIDAVMGRHVQW